MASATLTSKGQITLPKSVRDRLSIEAGDRIEFIESEQGFLVIAATRDIRSLKGMVGRHKKPVTLDDMNRVIEKMGRGSRDRPQYHRNDNSVGGLILTEGPGSLVRRTLPMPRGIHV